MFNKSKRNKIKNRITKKKYRQKTKKNYKFGGQQTETRGPETPRSDKSQKTKAKDSTPGPIVVKEPAADKSPINPDAQKNENSESKPGTLNKRRLRSDVPRITYEQIKEKIGFELPKDDNFNSGRDCYKFLEMADRELLADMEKKLHKYELNSVGEQYAKYMYLIRSTHPKSGNTVLHYICNHKNVEMFQLVFPYYLILYNEKFPELLSYYINKENTDGKTPIDLLDESASKISSTNFGYNLDYKSKMAAGSFGVFKNLVKTTTNIRKLASTAIRKLGNVSSGSTRAKFIRDVLVKFGGKKGSESTTPVIGKDEPDSKKSSRDAQP